MKEICGNCIYRVDETRIWNKNKVYRCGYGADRIRGSMGYRVGKNSICTKTPSQFKPIKE